MRSTQEGIRMTRVRRFLNLLEQNSKDQPLRDQLVQGARAYLGDYHEAEDAVQETFLHMMEGGIDRYDPSRSFPNWIRSSALNKCKDFLRAKYRSPVRLASEFSKTGMGLFALIPSEEPLPEKTASDKEEADSVRNELYHASEMNGAMIAMAYQLDYSHKTMAELLDVPIGTVKSRLHSAMKGLRRSFETRLNRT